MNKLFSTLFSSLRAKFTSLWTKLRRLFSPSFWQTKVITKLRQFFTALFDVRPRNKKDYYPVFRWLVSKRLAFAAVLVLGLMCFAFLFSTLPKDFFTGNTATTVRTYRYNAIPLKFYTGTVRILAGDGHLAYEGEVSDAHCVGKGTLFDRSQRKVYVGDFADDMFNGEGTLYYPEGPVRYQGAFRNNLFQGLGSYYRPTGTVEYTGEYESSHRNGEGRLFNAAANPIFSGTFQMDQIVYSQFLGKPTSEMAQLYTGKSGVYTTDKEYAVSMDEINAVYSVSDGTASLEGDWTVDRIYVLSDTFQTGGGSLSTINSLTAYFGEPNYYGVSWANFPEGVAINLLAQQNKNLLGSVEMTATAAFDGIYNVSKYNQDHQVYIYTYLRDGLLYTFYCTGAGRDQFVMYAIETT